MNLSLGFANVFLFGFSSEGWEEELSPEARYGGLS